MVSAQVGGNVVRSTAPGSTGAFRLARLDPGTYDVVITADGRATAVIAGVPVASDGSVVAVSSSDMPITLPFSDTREISGAVDLMPPDVNVFPFVSAKQRVGSVPSVTVGSQATDAAGVYTLSLPVAAPLVGQYMAGGTLPIPFDAEPATAGQYTVEAAAAGYQTKSSGQDISSTNASANFTLGL